MVGDVPACHDRLVRPAARADQRAEGKERIRSFDAPREIVWDTITDPEVIPSRLVERDGVTEMRDRSVFTTKEERDRILQTGMEVGARETYERLAELIATRAA
jgi:uncharacterized protein YndB with AHSA1/START domain